MEDFSKRPLKETLPYEHLFPKAMFTEVTYKKNANVADTVKFIPVVVAKTKWQVERFVKSEFKNLSTKQACEKLWHFIKEHIAYKKDEEGKEQVRSPRRLFWEKVGDCDCYTVFISACLAMMNFPIKLIHRITKYGGDNFQHIYPIVRLSNGEQIIMDCVVHAYNYEQPFTENKDYLMELNYLDGITPQKNPDACIGNDDGELGKLFDFLKKKPSTSATPKTTLKEKLKNVGSKIKAGTSKVLHAVNRINPATVLLRNGVLAAMKLNMMKVPQRLKYAYLTDAEAQKRGIDMAKFAKLKNVREKMEKIFFGAGGKPENLKEAILTGKGNTNKEVNGLGYAPDVNMAQMSLKTPLPKLLGQEMYYAENMEGLQELSGLGEPVTAASIGAASGVIASIAAILKSIGSIFKSKEAKGGADFENTSDADKEAALTPPTDLDNAIPPPIEDFSNPDSTEVTPTDDSANTEMKTRSSVVTTDTPTETAETKTVTTDPPKEDWWTRNKKWAKPTAWITGGLALLGIGYKVVTGGKKKKAKAVNGLPQLKTKKKKKGKSLNGPEIKSVGLM